MKHPGQFPCPGHLHDARACFAARWQSGLDSLPPDDMTGPDVPADGWLWSPLAGVQVPGHAAEGAQFGTVAPEDVAPALLVPGLLGDMVRSRVAPLATASRELESLGYRLSHAWVSGRQGSSANAAALRRTVLSSADHYGEAIHLIGYSKGCTDALHMLAEHPDTQDAVRSLCSLAGVVHGTPLVRMTPRWLRSAVRWLPWPGVAFGDGLAIEDLKPQRRREWLAEHPLPPGLRCVSVVAIPSRHRVSRILQASYLFLSAFDRCNDSQVIARDALLPQGELLAVLNADHWAVALPIEDRHSWLTRRLVTANAFPRTLLLRCLLDHLSQPVVGMQEPDVGEQVRETGSQ